MKKILSALLVFCVIALSGSAQNAQAQKIMETYVTDMPEITLIPEEEFNAKTKLYEATPMGYDSLAYRVRIPEGWIRADDTGLGVITMSSKIFGKIAEFFGPLKGGYRSSFRIEALELEFQYSAEQWLLKHLLSYGYAIQGFKVHDRNAAEALYVIVRKGKEYIVRTAVKVNGKHVVLAHYYMPTDDWKEERQQQAQVVASFELTSDVEDYVEPMLPYQFLDIARFQYPTSWELRAAPLRSLDRLSIELLNVAASEEARPSSSNKKKKFRVKLLDGKVEIRLVSFYVAESLESEIDRLKGDLLRSGLAINNLIETRDDFKVNEAFEFANVEVYQAVDSANNLLDYELWLSIMAAGEYYYFITLLTPTRDEDYFLWARNTQSYKVILELFEPMEKGEL